MGHGVALKVHLLGERLWAEPALKDNIVVILTHKKRTATAHTTLYLPQSETLKNYPSKANTIEVYFERANPEEMFHRFHINTEMFPKSKFRYYIFVFKCQVLERSTILN